MSFVLYVIAFILVHIKAQDSSFQDIVKQKTRGNQIQQCPCVIHPESKQCISYDSRYVAVNIEEAILSFLDLTNAKYPASLINKNTFDCQTEECKQCFSLLYNKINEIGLLPSNYRSSISVLPQNQINPSLCSKYKFTVPKSTPIPPLIVSSNIQSLINAGETFRRKQHTFPPAAVPSVAEKSNSRSNQNSKQNNGAFVVNQRKPNIQNTIQQPLSGLQQPTQFRNNQALRNRFNAQQRAHFLNNNNNNNNQRRIQNTNWQQPPRFAGNNRNNPQYQWNGHSWVPTQFVGDIVRNAAIFNNGWNSPRQSGRVPVVTPVLPHLPTIGGWFNGGPKLGGGGNGNSWSGGYGGVGGGGGGGGGSGSGGGGSGWGEGVFGGGDRNNHQNLFGQLGGIGFKNRQKRAANLIGKRFKISCTERGDSEDDMLSLCGSCWTWRQLPENYFPRIINELSCKTDDYCLSGWGECIQQYRNVDVLRRENGRWIPTVLTTATCCDCRVRAGTEIHSLVIGNKS